ncbi:Endonuclease/Exonuclease/phosphatase family protein [Mucinivorans hirudinis]|uniref:Endonuclease/Exonuclease/phosphatase family protein n=1 Tax=Mucinivorans hirudinis TaxID=1433126 RepID=A0A060R9H3_9BACT|nr:Endonuclease/Exonuclease/phosphatase family protein [Mucinivorans hirudinis]
MVKRILIKLAIWLPVTALIFAAAFIVVMRSTEWMPDEVEYQSVAGMTPDVIQKDTLKIVSWNIGYAGLGSDMDFFYDGGTKTRTSRERTIKNLKDITAFLKQHRDADFILLQEVDFNSKRSYHINEYDSLRAALPEFLGWWGINYQSQYVPIPLSDPIGRVKSGVVILSRHIPVNVLRLQYPSRVSFPQRMFDLKRCLLAASFAIGNDKILYINNTHNSAYDNGGMRAVEFAFLKNYLSDKPLSVTAGDWNSNPPGYKASQRELQDKHFSVISLSSNDFPQGFRVLADTTVKSVRYGYEPYNAQTTTRSAIDFALLGGDVEPVSVETVDLGFENSDHNPVLLTVKLSR